ncbi:MAG: hypothetical protein OEM90_18605 [Desulfobacteraceae bacterium]|nr:hypothetical protein [Desulfobacteraceae bacterium]
MKIKNEKQFGIADQVGFRIYVVFDRQGRKPGYQRLTHFIGIIETITGLRILIRDIYQVTVKIVDESFGAVGIVKLHQGRRTFYHAIYSRINITIEVLFFKRKRTTAQRIFIRLII